jgi:hypothetical protein
MKKIYYRTKKNLMNKYMNTLTERLGNVKNNIYDLYIFLCFFNNCIYSKNNMFINNRTCYDLFFFES